MRPDVRVVEPEILDHLAPEDPRAQRSRRDLQRIHVLMRTQAALHRALARLPLPYPPQRILELGAGDGSQLLRLARQLAPHWPVVDLTLLDQQELVSAETLRGYEDLGWKARVMTGDVLHWARAPCPRRYDLCIATLFLHHFAGSELGDILAAVAERSAAFVACEPRRDRWTRVGSRLVGLVGANRITRLDAVTSVAAGFRDLELSLAWAQNDATWTLEESSVFPFGHCFTARASVPLGEQSHA